MTYAQYGTVQATDYNNLVGGNPVTTSGKLNTVWATGGSTAGYGQTAIANVAAGDSVTAAQWANVVNKTANSASHQGTSITTVTAPVVGGTVTYLSAIPTNLTTIYTSRLNAATQGSTSANTLTTATAWSGSATFTHVVNFANGDAARYFFNSGGQLKLTMTSPYSPPPTGTIDQLMSELASNVGTIVLSAPSSGSITVAGISYNGISKKGGGGTTPTISTNSGYYALTTSNVTAFTQTASTGPAGYLGTSITVFAKSNGTQGSNSDAGSIITITTVWDEIPNGLAVTAGSTVTLTVQTPETTYLSNSWGAITFTGSSVATSNIA